MTNEQYLLQDQKGYYWIWAKSNKDEKPMINGPHSEKFVNLPVIKVENPLLFKPKD